MLAGIESGSFPWVEQTFDYGQMIPREFAGVLVVRDKPVAEITQERQRLLTHPNEITYLVTLPLEELENIYPGISSGFYLPEQPVGPKEGTSHLLKYFGATGKDDLLDRVEAVVQAIFPNGEKHAQRVIDTLQFMNQIHGEGKRKTGEEKVAHEARILLRTIADAVIKHEVSATTPSYYPLGHHTDLLSIHNQDRLSAILSAINCHDLGEDYSLVAINSALKSPYIQFKSANPPYLTLEFSHADSATLMKHIILALTNREYDPKYFNSEYALIMNIERMIDKIIDVDPRIAYFAALAIEVGKANDRDDNVTMLWTHKRGKIRDPYFAKLLETYNYFRFFSIAGWTDKHNVETLYNRGQIFKSSTMDGSYGLSIDDIPRALGTTLLKLLGGSDDELFGWMTEGVCKQVLDELEQAGTKPLIIPSPTQADILTGDGQHLIVNRQGDVRRYKIPLPQTRYY